MARAMKNIFSKIKLIEELFCNFFFFKGSILPSILSLGQNRGQHLLQMQPLHRTSSLGTCFLLFQKKSCSFDPEEILTSVQLWEYGSVFVLLKCVCFNVPFQSQENKSKWKSRKRACLDYCVCICVTALSILLLLFFHVKFM